MKYLIIRQIIFLVFSLLSINAAFAQELKNVKLSKEDKMSGIISKYEYIGKAHYSSVLLLFSTGIYKYEQNHLTGTLFNQGTWKRSKGQLFLKDTIEMNNLPITLEFIDKRDTVSDFVIKIIKNLKGEELTDGFIYINNDSTKCLPLMGNCLEKFEKIDSVKIVFENGYKSKWIKVNHRNYAHILPILRTDFLMYTYTYLRHKKYQIMNSYLKPLE